jgi:hypothetical protein
VLIRFQMRFLPALQKLPHCLRANGAVDHIIAAFAGSPLAPFLFVVVQS